MNPKVVYIISPENWGDNFISKHHYASELAKLGNEVYFFNPPSKCFSKISVASGLFVVNYKPIFRGLNKIPNFFSRLLYSLELKNILTKNSIPTPDIVWSFDTYRFTDLKVFKSAQFKLYYAADLRITPNEKYLVDSSSMVIAPSQLILNRFKTKTPTFFVNHGLSEVFLKKYKIRNLNQINRFRVGYVGNLVSRFINYELMLKVIDSFPTVEFHFIGPYSISNLTLEIDADIKEHIEAIREKGNTFFYGSKPVSELPSYYDGFDLFWLSYDTLRYYNEASNSHKIIEYLATGKPVLSTVIASYENSKLLEMCNDKEGFVLKLEHILKNYDSYVSDELVEARVKFAEDNTYLNQIKKIERLIDSLS